MRRIPGLSFALLAVFTASAIQAFALDPRLVSLVPPEAQVVAGMDARQLPGEPGSFVITTHSNVADLEDFFALTGVDSARIIRHVVFVAMDEQAGLLSEHSLLASGQFDQARIYKSAVLGGATGTQYRGIPVLTIEPFARESAVFHDVRWLAIPDSGTVLFGTIASVREELDRYLAGSPADASLLRRLSSLRPDSDTWCVLLFAARSAEIRRALETLNPALAGAVEDGDAFVFGLRYRRQVEFEYEVSAASSAAIRTISDSLAQSLAGTERQSFLPVSDISGAKVTARGTIRISTARYIAWLAEVAARGRSSGAP